MSYVMLINSPIELDTDEILGDEYWCPPLGLMYISSYLEKNGYRVRLIDYKIEGYRLQKLLEEIRKNPPLVIGISALTSSIKAAVELAKTIKAEFGDTIPVALGGSHISADPTIIERYPYFDFGITQEAEITFLQKVNEIKEGKTVKGLFAGEVNPELDTFPLPARHLVNYSLYKEKRVFIMTSRGCPFRCVFCSIPANVKKTRYRSAVNVVDEIESSISIFNGKFIFIDDTFTLSEKHARDVCNEIIRRKLKIKWTAQTRADRINEDLIKLMKKAGCDMISVGVESGSERVRNQIIKKNVSDLQIKNAINLCRKYHIECAIYLMLGFPTETKEDMLMTANFGLRYNPDIEGIHPTMPLPGSDIFEMAVLEKKIPENIIDQYIQGTLGVGFRGSWPHYVPDGISFEEIMAIRKKAYFKFYFRPSFIIRYAVKSLTSWQKIRDGILVFAQLLLKGRTQNSMS